MAGNAGGILKGGGGKSSGEPDTDEIVTRSPLSMVRIGKSLASKKPQWTVSGPASMCGISCDLCNEYLQSKFGKDRGQDYRNFMRTPEQIIRGPRIIAVACNCGHLWGEQHRIETRTKRNHWRVNSGRLTISGNYSRSPVVSH